MPHFSKKSISALVLVAVVSFAAFAQQKKTPMPRPSNLKVLPTNIPHDSLIYLMKEYSVSLGVKCNFCHMKSETDSTRLNFASDENKHKNMARYMMKMTSEINGSYFKEENSGVNVHGALMVSCFTCHHGNKEPEAFKMPVEEGK
ncbi:MAG: c-type cytochrome [Chitinophagaceae bacterium]